MRIPTPVIFGLIFLLASWAGAFGIAVLVTEWRDGSHASEYINCIDEALLKDLDQSEQHVGTEPVAPNPPGASASAATWDTYQEGFKQYRQVFDNWAEQGREISREYTADTRKCSDILH